LMREKKRVDPKKKRVGGNSKEALNLAPERDRRKKEVTPSIIKHHPRRGLQKKKGSARSSSSPYLPRERRKKKHHQGWKGGGQNESIFLVGKKRLGEKRGERKKAVTVKKENDITFEKRNLTFRRERGGQRPQDL